MTMKNLGINLPRLAPILTCLLLSGCRQEEALPPADEKNVVHTCPLVWEDDDMVTFGAGTRAATRSKQDGDCVYLKFQSGGNNIFGHAIYHATSDTWTLTYTGTLLDATDQSCNACFSTEAPYVEDTRTVSLSYTKPLYGDAKASYSKKGNAVMLRAKLSPTMGRIRFKGTPGQSFTFSGIEYLTDLVPNSLSLRKSRQPLEVVVEEDGYSPYLYVTPLNGVLSLNCNDKNYTATCHSPMLQPSKSGYMSLPTEDNTYAWKEVIQPEITHEYVDLGLPSGTLWATTNVGATMPADIGDFFAWGETEPKNKYTLENYKWWGVDSGYSKYDCRNRMYNNTLMLDGADDAATHNWGAEWSMPTIQQIRELIDGTYTSITRKYMSDSKGIKVMVLQITSNQNGGIVYLPVSGDSNNGYDTGYWSKEMPYRYYLDGNTSSDDAYNLFVQKDTYQASGILQPRYMAFPVRPVRSPQCDPEATLGDPLITSATQLHSPYSDPVEGTDLGALCDFDPRTFWHSDWHDNFSLTTYHWIQMELPRMMSGTFVLWTQRRDQLAYGDHPRKAVLTGALNSDFIPEIRIDTITLDNAIDGASFTSAPWVVPTPVKYIRFTVIDAGEGDDDNPFGYYSRYRGYWHAAEINLFQVATTPQ